MSDSNLGFDQYQLTEEQRLLRKSVRQLADDRGWNPNFFPAIFFRSGKWYQKA